MRNSQPEGIGRVANLGNLVCWNNLGRNVVFADRQFRPRAILGTTLFPDDDEPSQYDLDVHAILAVAETDCVLVLNHYGTVRGFQRADLFPRDGVRQVEPTTLWSFVGDVERTVIAAGRLVGSRPRSEGAAGLLVTVPLDTLPPEGEIPTQQCGQELGEVTALEVIPSANPSVVVGGVGTLALASIGGDELATIQWQTDVDFRVAALSWHGGSLWAAGPGRAETIDDYDWESLTGGRFTVVDTVDGTAAASGELPDDVAWGTGGAAVVPFGRKLAAMGRTGALHLVDPADPTAPFSTPPLSTTSRGIAHATVVGNKVLCGYNRGGYRLHAFGSASTEESAPPP